jgi:hypothetical protein
LIGLFRPRVALEAEVLVLRHQLNVLRRKSPKRVALNSIDRLLFVGLYRLAPGVLDALKIVRPETLMGWHRAGYRAYWRWKTRPRGGRHPTANQLDRQRRQAVVLILGPAVFDRHVLALDVAGFFQAQTERRQKMWVIAERPRAEKPDHRHRRLLRVCRKWPRRRSRFMSAPKLRKQHCIGSNTHFEGRKPGIKTIAAVHS